VPSLGHRMAGSTFAIRAIALQSQGATGFVCRPSCNHQTRAHVVMDMACLGVMQWVTTPKAVARRWQVRVHRSTTTLRVASWSISANDSSRMFDSR